MSPTALSRLQRLFEPPEWIEADKEYEGEVDLPSPRNFGRLVILRPPDGQSSFSVLERECERLT